MAKTPTTSKPKLHRLSTQERFDTVLKRLAEGEPLRRLLREQKLGWDTWYRAIDRDEKLRERYAQAREHGLDALAEECLAIADDGSHDTRTARDADGNKRQFVDSEVVARSRLRVDARKWLLSKMAPKKYGDRLDLQQGADRENPLASEIVVRYVHPKTP